MSKHKTNRKWHRNKVKCANYKARHLRELHKYKRVLQSSGKAEALHYALDHNIVSLIYK